MRTIYDIELNAENRGRYMALLNMNRPGPFFNRDLDKATARVMQAQSNEQAAEFLTEAEALA